MWTPHDIEVLLHHYCIQAGWPLGDTPAYRDSIARFAAHGLIDRTDFPRVTEKGEALIRMWCAQPVPVAQFVDPRFDAKLKETV
jgi:hypothetical protein